MKKDLLKLCITFILSFYIGVISAQNTFELEIDRIESTRNRVAFDAIEIDDGFFLTSWVQALEITDSGNYATDDVMLTKIDKEGNILWDKKYTTLQTHELTNKLFKTDNRKEFIFSYTRYSDTISAVINKIDDFGNIIWKNELPGMDYVGAIIELDNEDFIMSCGINIGGYKLLRFSNDGNLINEYKIQKNSSYYVKGLKIIDDYLYVYGVGGNVNSSGFIDKYDLEYNLIYSIELLYGDIWNQRIMTIFKKKGNYCFMTASRELYAFEPSTGLYNKLNEDFVNDENYQDNVNAYQGRVKQFLLTSNNHLLAHSEHSVDNNLSPHGRSRGVMIEIYDNEYKLKSYKFYVKDDRLILKDIIETSDGGLLFYGWYNGFYDENIPYNQAGRLYVLKTDCEGNKEWSTDACYIPQITALTLFPNPFSDVLKIQIPSLSEKDNYSLVLYNQLGQQVVNQKINSKITAINTSSLSKAMYFYKLINHSTTSAEGKVLKN